MNRGLLNEMGHNAALHYCRGIGALHEAFFGAQLMKFLVTRKMFMNRGLLVEKWDSISCDVVVWSLP